MKRSETQLNTDNEAHQPIPTPLSRRACAWKWAIELRKKVNKTTFALEATETFFGGVNKCKWSSDFNKISDNPRLEFNHCEYNEPGWIGHAADSSEQLVTSWLTLSNAGCHRNDSTIAGVTSPGEGARNKEKIVKSSSRGKGGGGISESWELVSAISRVLPRTQSTVSHFERPTNQSVVEAATSIEW